MISVTDSDLLCRQLFGRAPSAPTGPGDSRRTIHNMDGPLPAAIRRDRPGVHCRPATETRVAMRTLNCASVRSAGIPDAGTQMKTEVAALWADALESGKYTRGARRLKDGRGQHSALGVLCEVHRSLHADMPELKADGASYMGESALLPRVVLAWAGMDLFASQGPQIAVKAKLTRQWRGYSVDVHDFMGATWAEIARALRTQI